MVVRIRKIGLTIKILSIKNYSKVLISRIVKKLDVSSLVCKYGERSLTYVLNYWLVYLIPTVYSSNLGKIRSSLKY